MASNSKMTRTAILTFLLLASLSGAQQSTGNCHKSPSKPNTAITARTVASDAAADLIPYLLFLQVASPQPDSRIDEAARQRAYLRTAGLSDDEIRKITPILIEFRGGITQIERAAPAAAGEANRTALVTLIKSKIAASISSETMAKIDRFIQAERVKMDGLPNH